jgi:hypothetical protein
LGPCDDDQPKHQSQRPQLNFETHLEVQPEQNGPSYSPKFSINSESENDNYYQLQSEKLFEYQHQNQAMPNGQAPQ